MLNSSEDSSKGICHTCLKKGTQLICSLETDSNNVEIKSKLSFCVPEVKWTKEYICMSCIETLNQLHLFKQQCLKSSEILGRKYVEIKELYCKNEEFLLIDQSADISDSGSLIDTPEKFEYNEILDGLNKTDESNICEAPKLSKYECDVCQSCFEDRKLLFSHKKKIHKVERPFNCLFCDRLFDHSGELKRHEQVHLNQRNFTCDICNKSYNTAGILSKHKLVVHASKEDWKHECEHCDEKYPIKSSLDQHVLRHHTNAGNTFICYHCNECYDTRNAIMHHIKSKHSLRVLGSGLKTSVKRTKKFSCEKCGKKYTTTQMMKVHAKSCDGIKRQRKKSTECESSRNENGEESAVNEKKQRKVSLNCEICNEFKGTYKKLMVHVTTNHEDVDPETLRPYVCIQCNTRYKSSLQLANHKRYHSTEKVHMCSFCGRGFAQKKDMLNHEKLHSDRREVQCEMCPKRFHTRNYLRSHVIVVHTDRSLWKYTCPFCGRKYPMKSNIDAHIRRHTGEKPFACHLCDKRFTDKAVLQRHFFAHSNVRNFKCDYCEKEYKSKDVLKIHLKKAHDIGNAKIPVSIKKFSCDYCPKMFSAKNKLRRHMYSHTGEMPFSCYVCDKKFTDRSYVKHHLRSVHNIQEVTQY